MSRRVRSPSRRPSWSTKMALPRSKNALTISTALGALCVHRLCELGAEQHGGDGADEAPAGSGFENEHDQRAVDKDLHREGYKERHPFERMTEPRRWEKDLRSETRAH